MKKNILLFLCLLYVHSFISQDLQLTEKISEIEKKSFSNGKLNFKKISGNKLVANNYDILLYTLDLNVNPGSSLFSGNTEIKFKALQALNQIELNAKSNLIVTSFDFNGNNYTTFTQNSGILNINLPITLSINSINSIKINYTGTVNNIGILNSTHAGQPVLYTLSESFHASEWYICKDDLTDKADEGAEIFITHPNTMKAGSNGTLQSITAIDGISNKTHWKTNIPIVPYLIAIAVTNYAEYNTSVNINGTTMPIINYVYPENLASNITLLDNTANYINYFSNLIIDYPYKHEKYGHCQWNIGGGMEHATMSFMVNFDRTLVAHELAHQWFGDYLTCGSWKDIWLNEGFATYFAALILENQDGATAFNNLKSSYINSIISSSGGSVYIHNDIDALDENRIFNYRLSYLKGSMVLHMLRFKLGDTVFFQAIKNYLNDLNLKNKFVLTPNLITHFNTTSGENLQEFFNDWVYGEGFPIFDLHVDNSFGNVTLTVNQTQSHSSVSYYETPFEVTFIGANGETATRKLNLTSNGQIFNFTDIPFLVSSYTFNGNSDIICKVNSKTLSVVDYTKNSNSIKIFPNPAKEKLEISTLTNIDKVQIYNSNGQLIMENIGNKSQNQIVNISTLDYGNYVIKVLSEGKLITEKFIKK